MQNKGSPDHKSTRPVRLAESCRSCIPTQGFYNKVLFLALKVFAITPLKFVPHFCCLYWLTKFMKHYGRLIQTFREKSRSVVMDIATDAVEVMAGGPEVIAGQAGIAGAVSQIAAATRRKPPGEYWAIDFSKIRASQNRTQLILNLTGRSIEYYVYKTGNFLLSILGFGSTGQTARERRYVHLALQIYSFTETLFFLYQKYRIWTLNEKTRYAAKIPMDESLGHLEQELQVVDDIHSGFLLQKGHDLVLSTFSAQKKLLSRHDLTKAGPGGTHYSADAPASASPVIERVAIDLGSMRKVFSSGHGNRKNVQSTAHGVDTQSDRDRRGVVTLKSQPRSFGPSDGSPQSNSPIRTIKSLPPEMPETFDEAVSLRSVETALRVYDAFNTEIMAAKVLQNAGSSDSSSSIVEADGDVTSSMSYSRQQSGTSHAGQQRDPSHYPMSLQSSDSQSSPGCGLVNQKDGRRKSLLQVRLDMDDRLRAEVGKMVGDDTELWNLKMAEIQGWFRYRKDCINNSYRQAIKRNRFQFDPSANPYSPVTITKKFYNFVHSIKCAFFPSFVDSLARYSTKIAPVDGDEDFVAWEDLGRENIREWLCWAFLNAEPTESEEIFETSEGMIDIVEQWLNNSTVIHATGSPPNSGFMYENSQIFPPGYNEDVVSMRITLDPLRPETRSWVYYAFTQFMVPQVCRAFLAWMDFEESYAGSMLYYSRRPNRVYDEEKVPIVFCHGLGVGIAMYAPFLIELCKSFPDRDIFLTSIPHIALQVHERPIASPAEIVSAIGDMLSFHYPEFGLCDMVERSRYDVPLVRGFDASSGLNGILSPKRVVINRARTPSPRSKSSSKNKTLNSSSNTSGVDQKSFENPLDATGKRKIGVHLMGHSFGTFVMAWIIRRRPDLVKFATFLDPVCFRLFSPDLAYNMVYRAPKTWLQLGIQYFAAKELHISHCLQHQLHWQKFVLWPEKLKFPTNVVLSALDSVLPAHSIRVFLTAIQEIRKQHLLELSAGKKLPDAIAAGKISREELARNAVLKVVFFSNLGHGEWMARPGAKPAMHNILDKIAEIENVTHSYQADSC